MRQRRCVATGEERTEDRLVRLALAPDGALVPDAPAKLPGRGVWVSADRASVALARKKNAFARSLKAPAQAGADLEDRIEAALAQRCLDLLGLGKRAGALAIGFDQAEAAVRQAPRHAMAEASDGAADGRDKLLRLGLGVWGKAPLTAGCFTAAELGVALGRDPVVHVVWLQERMARFWSSEVSRLAGFRAIVPHSWRAELHWPMAHPGGAAREASSLNRDHSLAEAEGGAAEARCEAAGSSVAEPG